MLTKLARNARPRLFRPRRSSRRSFSHHSAQESDDEPLPSEWYRAAYAKLIRLADILRNVEHIDGRIMHVDDGSIITEERTVEQMQSFNSLARSFVGSPSMRSVHGSCFESASGLITLNSLTKVCNLLDVSAQQRKSIRLIVCPQVTQHHIWKGALEEVLVDLKREMDTLGHRSPAFQMGQQILSTCLRFFSDTTASDAPSWMKPPPLQKVEKPSPSRTWEEALDMFVDLTKCLEVEPKLAAHASKVEAMKEGLYQIRDIIVEQDITYKEVRRQDCLVQRNLSKNLGHSSRCLFTLLLYYLYGSVQDVEAEVWGGVRGMRDGRSSLCIGKILTGCEEEMVWRGIRQLSRALGVCKFVWEAAAMAGGKLELQGHLWCVGAEERSIKYGGHVFFLHGIKL